MAKNPKYESTGGYGLPEIRFRIYPGGNFMPEI